MFTNNTNLPLSIAVWLSNDDYDHNSDPYTVSATSLLKPIKSLVLGSRIQSASSTDIADLIPSRMGTAVHTAIENAWLSKKLPAALASLRFTPRMIDNVRINPTKDELFDGCIPVYMEIRGSKKVGKYTVSGKFDFVSEGVLEDFKTTGTYGYINQSNKDKYIQQGSIYKWLFPEIITEPYMIIDYIFTDWSSAKARMDKSYPSSRILPQKYILKSEQDTEAFVSNRISLLDKYEHSEQSGMPACTPEELWERPTVYKYYKDPAKRARSTKNFDNSSDAYIKLSQDGSVGIVVEVSGEVKFCAYCPAVGICEQAQGYVASGRLSV
jgi:hypothetical protein